MSLLTPNPLAPFSIIEAFLNGLRLCYAHARLFSILSFLPFAVTLLTLVALRFLGPNINLFWLPIIQMLSSFAIGIQTALILRFVLLHEYPIIDNPVEKRARNSAVMLAGAVYAVIIYFITGVYAGLLELRDIADKTPELVQPWTPLILAGFVLFVWGARWLWLHVPLALHWPVDAFYERVGRWGGSLRIFALFMICSVLMNYVTAFVRMIIVALAGKYKDNGFVAAFDDGAISLATVVLAVLFAACTAAAIKSMMRPRGTVA